MKIAFFLNGKKVSIDTHPKKKLIDIIRNDFHLTGTKKGCEQGECGSCLVFMSDTLVNSCMVPAFRISGKNIITIEGFSQTKEFNYIEEAFTKLGIVLCGFCTPGIVLSIGSLLSHTHKPHKDEIKEALSGNMCRCNGFLSLIDVAVEAFKIKQRKRNVKR